MLDLHEQLKQQQEQETQITNELDSFMNRVADEYAVTKYQLASALEQAKLKVLGFTQEND